MKHLDQIIKELVCSHSKIVCVKCQITVIKAYIAGLEEAAITLCRLCNQDGIVTSTLGFSTYSHMGIYCSAYDIIPLIRDCESMMRKIEKSPTLRDVIDDWSKKFKNWKMYDTILMPCDQDTHRLTSYPSIIIYDDKILMFDDGHVKSEYLPSSDPQFFNKLEKRIIEYK